MANKKILIEAVDVDFSLGVKALAFNGGAPLTVDEATAVPLAINRLRSFIRDEIKAHAMADLQAKQQAQSKAFEAGLKTKLDTSAGNLTITLS